MEDLSLEFCAQTWAQSMNKILALILALILGITVNAPNIEHFSLLTSVGHNKKETNLKNCANAAK